MHRGVILVLLTGCSLVWDPDGYVGERDASVMDTGTDGGGEEDAPADVPLDVLDAGGVVADAGPCTLIPYERPGEPLMGDLTTATVSYAGAGAALIVDTDGLLIEDVEIRLGGEATVGIRIEPGVSNVTINRVRVVLERAMTPITRHGLVVAGTIDSNVRIVQVDGFEVEGLLGIDATSVQGSTFKSVHVLRPAGEGSPIAIRCVGCVDVSLDGFAIGPEQAPMSILHAIHIVDSREISITNGVIEATCTDYPVLVAGGVESDPRNAIENVAVVGSERGFRFDRAMDWDLAAKVVRASSCTNGQYAFDDTGSDQIECIDCWEFGCEAALRPDPSMLTVGKATDDVYDGAEPIELCFPRTPVGT